MSPGALELVALAAESASPVPWRVVRVGTGRANVISGSDGGVATSATGACTPQDAELLTLARNEAIPRLLEVSRLHHSHVWDDGCPRCAECHQHWPCRTAIAVGA